MSAHNSAGCIHRVGGGDEQNLALKPQEAKLDRPGISVQVGGTPADTAAAFRRVFGPRSRLGQAASIVGTAEIDQIRAAGFDVVPVPTTNFPNQGRIIHPTEGAAGFHQHNGTMTMAESTTVFLLGPEGNTLAELSITDEEDGWFTGWVVWQNFPFEVTKTLAWYDEVVQDQMLSYLDEASLAVQRLELQARFPDGSTHKTYSLHVSPANEVSFRTSPVLPSAELPKEAIQ